MNKPINGDIKINKPTPIISEVELVSFNQESDIQATIDTLVLGKYVLIEGFYSNGLNLLSALQTYLKSKYPNQDFQGQRAFRAEYRKLSNLILIEINKHKLSVRKAPTIGWFEKLYPNEGNFLLPKVFTLLPVIVFTK